MVVFAWCSRRAGGLSVIALLTLCYWVISRESSHHRHEPKQEDAASYTPDLPAGAGIWTFAFAYYCLLIHTLVFMVPFRACWSVWNLTRTLKRAAQSSILSQLKRLSLERRDSLNSISSSETLISHYKEHYKDGSSSTTSEAGDIDPELYTDGGDSATDLVIQAIIIPNYKEEYDTLRETLEVLASHPRAQDSYDVYLGMEQREDNAESKALGLIQEFAKKFRSIDFALHPGDIHGEAAGKGSNVAWAARELSSKYDMGMRKDVIITGIDADSHLSSDYFALITNMHLAFPETATSTLYSAPIIFDRNAHEVPALVRVADILWCAAGLSGLYGGSSIAPPTSVYSLPLELVDRVGGWDCDSEAIGEDLHMFVKCFFALNGNLTCRVVNSPVSQSNITSGCGKGYRGVYGDVKARYKQALRHMWGALDTGFALRKGVEMWRRRKQTTRVYRPLHSTHSATSDMYMPNVQVTDSELNQFCENGIFTGIVEETIDEPHWEHVFYLFHRLFEAHFLPVHMTILVVASTLYVKLTEGNGDPWGLAWAFNICNIARIVGFAQVVFYLFLYESYHRVCVAKREKEMAKAGLSDGMRFSQRSLRRNLIDYVMVPLVAPIYGAIPCIQAQISHLWTVDLVYTVSKKATRRQQKSVGVEDLA